MNTEKIIWTIGHSTHSLEKFISMLKSFSIEFLIDIRAHPGSRKYPHFNKEALKVSLQAYKIEYVHLPHLGGRRKSVEDSKNTAWRNPSFRGYADYMSTDSFKDGTRQLQSYAEKNRTAYMCSESVWWRCHRA